jgi:hypothetical protein
MTQQELSSEEPPTESHKELAIPKTDDPGTGAVSGMPNIEARNVIGIFASREAAASAQQALEQAGFTHGVIIVADQPVGTAPEISASDTRSGQGLWTGAMFGAMIGLVLGVIVAAVPSLREMVSVGPFVSMLFAILIGAVFGGLVGSYLGLSGQTRHAQQVETATRAGGTTVTVKVSSAGERDQVIQLLRSKGARAVSSYQEAL